MATLDRPLTFRTRHGRFTVRHASLMPVVLRYVRTLDAVIERRECGANAKGGGGFQAGNTCGKGEGGGGGGSPGGSGGSGKRRAAPRLAAARDVASKEITSEVQSWIDARAAAGYDMSGAPSAEAIEENWNKAFRSRKQNEGDKPAFSDLNPQRKSQVESAVEGLASNKSFAEFAEEHGYPLVIFRRAEKGNSAAAEFRGAIHVYDKGGGIGGIDNSWPKSSAFEAGVHSAGDYGGYEAIIRHEYGHQLYSALPRTVQSEWQREYLKIDKASAAKELTRYSTENPEEMFCEVFAAATDPVASGKLPQWARELHQKQREWLLKRGSK